MIQDIGERHLPPHESWKYILRVMEDEIIYFKTKLARILADDFERAHLEHLEIFQHRFLKIDEQIVLLRHEIRELQEIQVQQENAASLQEALAVKIDMIQTRFDVLAEDFKIYLRRSFPSV